jgi:hypothetical protein
LVSQVISTFEPGREVIKGNLSLAQVREEAMLSDVRGYWSKAAYGAKQTLESRVSADGERSGVTAVRQMEPTDDAQG